MGSLTEGKEGAWDPEVYARFRDERRRPFLDLVALVARAPAMRVLDLGCGTGEPTRALHDALGAAETLGVDSSAEMLARSADHAGNGVSFALGDISTFEPAAPLDLVFSNAAIHWVPDHEALLARFRRFLAPRGQLAVQVPDMRGHASHRTASELASEEPFASALGPPRLSPVLAPERYAELLFRLGFVEQTVKLQIYGHVLPGPEAVVEWVRGTLLTDYRGGLPAALWELFLSSYTERLLARLPDERPFFYPYRRILMSGRLP